MSGFFETGRAIINSTCRIADAWLGVTQPVARQCIEAAGWTPDAPEHYCTRCGGSVGQGEVVTDRCSACRGRQPGQLGVDGYVRLGRYDEPLREWILRTKFDRWADMGGELGRLLGASLRADGRVDRESAVIVPSPMPWQRRLYRGIDHAAVIADGVSYGLGAPVARILTRSNGPTQLSVHRAERTANAVRGMRRRWRMGGWPLDGLDVVLVDDVRTTGSTMRAAARLVRRLQPRIVLGSVIAVADEPARGRRTNSVAGE